MPQCHGIFTMAQVHANCQFKLLPESSFKSSSGKWNLYYPGRQSAFGKLRSSNENRFNDTIIVDCVFACDQPELFSVTVDSLPEILCL